MKKLKIGIMGCASIAERLVIPSIIELSNYFELVAVSSRSIELATTFAKKFNIKPILGYQQLIDEKDIDVIYMPLPTGLHEEWVMKTIYANKHILVEKSFAINVSSSAKMINLAKNSNILLMENFMFLYHSQHKYVSDILDNNTLGNIRLIRSQFGFPPLNDNNFRYNNILGGGSLLDAASYTIRASQWLSKINLEVQCANLFIDKKLNIDIYGNATLINKNGLTAQISFGFDNSYQCNYEIWGSKGKLFLHRAFTPKPNETTKITIEKDGTTNLIDLPCDNHFKNILIEFYKSIIERNFDKHYDDILIQSNLISQVKSVAKLYYI